MLAIDDSDYIYVVWEDYRSGSDWDVYLASSTNNGNSFGTNARVNDASNDNQRKPSISVDANDNIHVVWYDARSGNNYVYYTKSTDAGGSFGTDDRVCGSNAVVSSMDPPVVAVNSDLDPCIAWADSRNGNDDIYFCRGVNNAPACAIASPVSDSTVSGTITVTGTASDPDGNEELVRVEVRINSETWNTATGTTSWSYTLNTNSLTNGQHTIYARAYDGDLYSAIYSVSVNVNNPSNLPPVVSIWAPAYGSTLSGSEAVIAGNATDPDGDTIDFVQVRIDSGNWIEARGTNGWAAWVYSLDTTTLSNGQHTIYARAYDGALYSELESVTIFVSNAGGNLAPVVSIVKPVNGEEITENYIIEGTSSDQNGDVQIECVEIKIDNGTWEMAIPVAGQNNWTAWVYYLDFNTLPLGEHTIYAWAHDGMAYSTEVSVSVNIATPSGGSNLALWVLIIVIIILLVLLLLALMKNRKKEPTEYEKQPIQPPHPYSGHVSQQPKTPPPEYPKP